LDGTREKRGQTRDFGHFEAAEGKLGAGQFGRDAISEALERQQKNGKYICFSGRMSDNREEDRWNRLVKGG
jgi:hypothetical protein